MGGWPDLNLSIFIGIFLSFLVAKLISMVISFREENPRVVHDRNSPPVSFAHEADTSLTTEHEKLHADLSDLKDEKSRTDDDNLTATEKQSRLSGSPLQGGRGDNEGDEDDWEGVESTELDEAFSAATAFVATAAADSMQQKVSNDVQLQLYGLYKIATEGPCSAPQPSAFKMTARAKWNAWQRLGAMPPEEAMQKYITIIDEVYPSWATGSKLGKVRAHVDPASKGPMGPVFSSFIHEERPENELKLDIVHDLAREGSEEDLLRLIVGGASVNLRDSEGRTPLHWAVDRGHINVVELLLSRNADVNAKDNEGQTPLHYASVCDREAIAELLVKHAADKSVKDNDGNTPLDLCESSWKWMHS